ncbi:Alcohol dehydrogenase [Fulvia fulva]|uniref:Alcohol dehydrogenase n=1 Tax=Passalora fulva TaxID=5499 RepID=A0A9Q8PLC1_PASFU|nr:Alcohol dehydrogenase [Fulvia fulva]KAK4610612.1 alcohol dehydrogenase [Fulvia fulva]KAK4610923.1 alcohol dehydrogenase [Fulvia fulva]UJO24636.1 Alcohol dehydrogenase [Fulvia fulva]WPV22318.1 Alcohol dehydrogenase [Fulvia fulva]WPV36779.1 Alcohol dehydrogenase [Fulvia fulva]
MAASIPKTMQAWRYRFENTEPHLAEAPVPVPAADGLLVKVLAMGVCHSDCTLLGMNEPILGMRPEFTMGHEACGEIVQLGSDVDKSAFAIGDKIVMLIIPGCGKQTCPDCSRGFTTICRSPDSGNYGLGISDGFFAEYVTVAQRAAVKVPEGLDLASAAVSADAVLTAYQAIKDTGNPQPDHTIAIFGLGGVGLNGLQTALHMGVKNLLVADKRQASLDEAIKLGVPKSHTFLVGEGTPIEQYVAEQQLQVDMAFDFAGHEQTFQAAQMVVRNAGTIVLVGLFSPTVPLIPLVSVLKAVTIKCHYNGDIKGLRECLELVGKGVLKPVVETGSIRDLPRVLKDLDEGRVRNRMVLLPDWKE